MRIKKLALLLTLLPASVPSLAAPSIRQPTGKWVVNFDDAQCLASRNYGTPEKPLILALKAPALGDVMQIVVAAPGQVGEPKQLDGKIAFDAAKVVETSMLAFTPSKDRQRIFLATLPTSDFAAARTAKSISISGAGHLDERFALDQIDSVLKVMDECVADLRQVWNVATELSPPLLREPAKGDVRGLLRGDHYPEPAMRQNQQGGVKFVLLVDESGRVADCTVIETSGVASLDAQTCAILKDKARFTPAIGMDGKPAKDSHVQRVTWRIES